MTARAPTAMAMVSGGYLDLAAPDWRDIELADIAYGLAALRRWNGQARRHVCVAAHSRGVAARMLDRRLRLPALLHDAHEAPFGDWTRPAAETLIRRLAARFAISAYEVAQTLDAIKQTLDVAICRAVLAAFGPDCYADGWSEYAEAAVLAQEMRRREIREADRAEAESEETTLARGVGAPFGLKPPPPDDVESLLWLDAVKAACAARYGGGRS